MAGLRSDGKLMLEDKTEIRFRDALYNGACSVCNSIVSWEAHFDADGTDYTGYCQCRDKSFYMHPSTVSISIEKEDEVV